AGAAVQKVVVVAADKNVIAFFAVERRFPVTGGAGEHLDKVAALAGEDENRLAISVILHGGLAVQLDDDLSAIGAVLPADRDAVVAGGAADNDAVLTWTAVEGVV